MHGLILTEFKEYVVEADHTPAWEAVARRAEVAEREYRAQTNYPDEEVVRVAQATADLMNMTTREVLVEYGEKVMYSLYDIYQPLTEDDWGSLELMMEVEERFHPTVRERSGGKPPLLKFERQAPHEVTLKYKSPRKLCGIAIGTGHALQKTYDEDVTIQEEQCMHEGADHCFIRFTRAPVSSADDEAGAPASHESASA
jgi:hypothetical protein